MRTRTSHARLSFRLKLLIYLVSIVVLTVLLLILAVAFPAFCVWLTVRFVNRGWRPRRRFWLFMPLVLATGYVLSVGPLNWCYENHLMPTPVVDGLRIVFSPLDINPAYLQVLASRFPSPAFELSLECADVACYSFPSERFDLVHVPLVFEYVDWERLLPALVSSLRLHGLISVVVQRPSSTAPAVSSTQYASLRKLERLFRFVPPDILRVLAAGEGLSIEREFEVPLQEGKAFHILYLRRKKTAPGTSGLGAAAIAETMRQV